MMEDTEHGGTWMKRLTILLLFLILLTGCGQNAMSDTRDFFAMDTVMSVTVYGETCEEDTLQAVRIVQETEKKLDVTDAKSTISQLNETGEADLSEDTAELLRRALQIRDETGGAFDPTIYDMVRLWGFTTGEYRVPSEQEITDALAKHQTSTIVLEGNHVTISGCAVDFGAVAKGYTAAKIAAELSDADALNLSLGGNVQLEGEKPDGTLWRVGIKDPNNTTENLGILELESGAVVTSGGYERYFEEDGVRYSHIIDPRTGYPADAGLSSVTIVSKDGLLADALSTALYVMGLENAAEFWAGRTDFEAVLVGQDGTVYVTEGLKDSLTGCEFKVIAR